MLANPARQSSATRWGSCRSERVQAVQSPPVESRAIFHRAPFKSFEDQDSEGGSPGPARDAAPSASSLSLAYAMRAPIICSVRNNVPKLGFHTS